MCSECKNVPVQTEQNETDSESKCFSTTDSDVSCDDIDTEIIIDHFMPICDIDIIISTFLLTLLMFVVQICLF